jgi:hypothetical protein
MKANQKSMSVLPLKEIDGSSCCVSNNFGPKFNNEKKHMLSKESGKKTPHAQNQPCKIKWNVLSQIPFLKSHNF